ncbi:LacI family DNA-binding transcriptional regulator [Mycolicibacterium goodii]|uniref:LacI family DNA-binding transcriptional regulator n=1 Tax=Mycolicibacterium goodii TaxID=134601 RepID=UPI00296F9436
MTSFDVAKLAGVSQPTVSRALRNLPGTSPETRERVLAAALELNYIPSASGRTLSTRTTQRVAIVAEELTNPFYSELVEPLRNTLSEHGYRAVLVTDRADDPVTVDALADGSYDGVLLCTVTRRSTLPRDLTERGIAHVLVNRILDVPESGSCSFDNVAGGRLVGEFLCQLGHQRIGALHGTVDNSTARDRALGLRNGLRAHGLHVRRTDLRRVPFSYAAGYQGALELLDRPDRPSALFCGNDVIAIGALSAAKSLGIRVPEDLTIVGFDDIGAAGWGTVDLTTVNCDRDELARESVELLLRAIGGAEPEQHVIAPTGLVRRGTHGRRIR